MRKLVCVFVLLLAVCANAGTINSITRSTATPDAAGGYVYDVAVTGNETRVVRWNDEPESSWDGGHRDVGQNFQLATSQWLGAFAYRMDPRGTSDYAGYVNADRGIALKLYELTGTNYQYTTGTLVKEWTGTLTTAINGAAADSWCTFDIAENVYLEAGKLYGLKIGFTTMVPGSWTQRLSYGIFSPGDGYGPGPGWAVYTGGDPQTYYKTWRSGRFALITPEPATIALISLGGLLVSRRRK